MKLLYPTRNPYITQHFGNRSGMYLSYHKGTDFRVHNDPKREILSAQSGTVITAATNGADWFRLNGGWTRTANYKKGSPFGNHIVIDHGGYFTLYGHLSNVYVAEGDTVKAGSVIGKGGNTGYSQGAHLHFELRNGKNSSSAAINSEPYLTSYLEEEIPEWGKEAWQWGKDKKILSDMSNFDDHLTKGEMMVLLHRYDKNA
jgi:murein DD-endopeptidase MepM/ murein hydrolase activator NlpD